MAKKNSVKKVSAKKIAPKKISAEVSDAEKIFAPGSSAPRVSVILSSYNHEKYVAAAIESVLAQTFTDFELLIFDDGSTDSSREIIKTFTDPRIKTFLSEVNRGPRILFSDCVAAAKGKYIAIHHSDDLWTADKLEKQVDFLDSHANYAACFSRADFVDEDGNFYTPEGSDIFEHENMSRAEWLRYFFYNANCLCHPSLLIRRSSYETYNLLKFNGLWQLSDYFMWIQLCFHADFYILPEKLVQFRLRRKNQENTSAPTYDKRVRVETEMFFIAKNFADNFSDDKFFLEVFPESEKYVRAGEINRNFAFAQICLANSASEFAEVFQLIGLSILKELLTDENSAAQIKKLYDYDEKNFLRDTGDNDIFNIKQKFSMLTSRVYFSADENFNLSDSVEKILMLSPAGKFYAQFNYFAEKPVQKIRFDPDETFCSVKVEFIKVNGVEIPVGESNAAEVEDGFHRFRTWDPQFIFDVENLRGKITVEASGFVEKDYFKILNRDIEKIQRENSSLADTNSQLRTHCDNLESANAQLKTHCDNLESANAQLKTHCDNLESANSGLREHCKNLETINANLQTANATLNQTIAELSADRDRLNRLLNELTNSTSWKVTEPLRRVGSFVKKHGRK